MLSVYWKVVFNTLKQMVHGELWCSNNSLFFFNPLLVVAELPPLTSGYIQLFNRNK